MDYGSKEFWQRAADKNVVQRIVDQAIQKKIPEKEIKEIDLAMGTLAQAASGLRDKVEFKNMVIAMRIVLAIMEDAAKEDVR